MIYVLFSHFLRVMCGDKPLFEVTCDEQTLFSANVQWSASFTGYVW